MRTALLAALLAASGCIKEYGEATPIQCLTNSDCNSGEECRSNLCFGNPPNLDFAAIVVAPETEAQLTRTEIEHLTITPDGRVDISFEPGVEVSGRVLIRPGDPISVGARVTFHRPSRIPGAPDWELTVVADPGKAAGQPAFHARLSRNNDNELYDVTIVPADQGNGPPSALAPTVHFKLPPVKDDLILDLTLSDQAGLKTVSSQVLDAAGRGLKGMTVKAYGRRTLDDPWDVCSSVGVTDDTGKFVLYVPVSWDDAMDVVVSPGPGMYAPSLRHTAVYVPDPTLPTDVVTFEHIQYPSYPHPVRVQLPVFGEDRAGGKTPAVGAAVTFTTFLLGGLGDIVTYTTQATVASNGQAEAQLLPGDITANRSYSVDVVPLPNAHHALAWGQTVMVGPPNPTTGDGGVLAELDLGPRAYITGRVLDADMLPADLVTVRPQPSPYFTLPLAPDARARVAAVPLPEVISDKTGAFGVYLDPMLYGVTPFYDLELVPAASSLQPRWSFDRVSFAAGQLTRDVQEIVLPRASLAESYVKDAEGYPVANVEVDLYVRSSDTSLCGVVTPPNVCVPPARLRDLARSDKHGWVVLVLPSP